MKPKNLVFVALMAVASSAQADTQPIWERDADAQEKAVDGHKPLAASAALIDQYRDKLDEVGRWGYVKGCLEYVHDHDLARQTIEWALCGDDLKALDLEKVKTWEDHRWAFYAKKIQAWKELGDKIKTEAKSDPGIRAILELADAAKADWKAFEEKNRESVALYQTLKEGVRTQKSTDKRFDGCWEATQPAFAKLVKATTFRWDNDGDEAIEGRVSELVTDPASYYTVANFGMCAFSVHPTGAVLARAALNARGGAFGWRTMFITKVLAPTFKPKFADRSISGWESDFGPTRPLRGHVDNDVSAPWPGGSMKIQTGTITKLTKDGDDTAITFKGAIVDACLDWIETNKIRTWDTAGDPVYETICKKRGKKQEDAPDPATFGTKLTDGFAPGVGVAFIGSFPAEAWKGKKFVSILGVAVKGSPAETPRK